MAIIFSFCPFAFASEDSPSPFPDDMYISDLSDLPELPDMIGISEAQNNVADSITLSTPIDIPKENIETSSQLENSAEDYMNNSFSIPVADNDESTEPKPIFVPKSDEQDDNNNQNIVNKNQSLTETLKNDRTGNIIEGTWIEKLAKVRPLSVFEKKEQNEDNLETLVKKSRKKNKEGRSNASVFDISGIMLRMNLNQVEKTLKNRGFQKINAKFTIPNFIKWRNEETCSSQGIVGFERMQSCVNSMAKKAGHEYVYYLKYAKFDSKEEIEIFLTSNFTENKVHKIIYRSQIPAVYGNSQKAIYMRNIKVYDFWKKINQKYGAPDDKNNVTWGLGGNKPFLKATTGYLLLEDPMFAEMDYTRMSREDKRYVHSDFYNF